MSRMILVECPICHSKRHQRWTNYLRGGATGLCLDCYNHKQGRHVSKDGLYYHDGYILLRAPNHHRVNKFGLVKRAILILETKLGRLVENDEHVHHLNGIRDDDRPENLVILTNSDHARLHMKAKPNIKNKYIMALTQQRDKAA